MLVIEATGQVLRTVARGPRLVVVGLVAMAAAGALDVVVHLSISGHALGDAIAPEHLAHLLGVAGMVLVLAGVVTHGVRLQLRQRADRSGGRDGNAHR